MARGYSNLEAAPPHSDLEVAYDHASPMPVVPSHAEKMPAVGHAVSSEPFHYDPSNLARAPDLPPQPPSETPPAAAAEKKRMCGLPVRTFIIVLVVLVIVVAGAIGGGIAGAQEATRQQGPAAGSLSRPAEDATTTTAPPSTAAPTTTAGPASTVTPATTAAAITTTRLPNPENPDEVLERDCPSSDGSVYEALQSPLYQFRKLCGNKYVGFGTVVINTNTDRSLDACIDRCAEWNVANKDRIRAGDAHMCNSVCWRNSWDQDLPGQCFGFPLQNATGGGAWRVGEDSTSDARCDSAAWMNPYTM